MPRRLLATLVLISVASSCASQGVVRSLDEKSGLIFSGMERSQVLLLLGQPGKRDVRGGREALQYCKTGFFNDQYTTIFIAGGRVQALSNTTNPWAFGSCGTRFPDVNWYSLAYHG